MHQRRLSWPQSRQIRGVHLGGEFDSVVLDDGKQRICASQGTRFGIAPCHHPGHRCDDFRFAALVAAVLQLRLGAGHLHFHLLHL